MICNKHLILQLFAEEVPPVTEGDAEQSTEQPAHLKQEDPKREEQKKQPKYTDNDVDRILNQKFAEWQTKKQKEIDEAKRLADMDAQQKAEYERDKLQKQLDELMKERNLTEMSKTARGILSEKNINLNDELLAMLVSDNADATKKNIDFFVEMFQAAVKKEVADALKGPPPKTGSASGYTREQILAIKNRVERQKLIDENKNLFI